jgi:hypothetical protein
LTPERKDAILDWVSRLSDYDAAVLEDLLEDVKAAACWDTASEYEND